MVIVYVLLGVVGLLVIYVLATYNGFVRLNNTVKEAFSTMDVYLKKRWDLIPNLVETVKGYAKHESETLEKVTQLRSASYESMSDEEKVKTNQELTGAINKLIAVAENYPDLKANENFRDLSGQLTRIEEDIANSRKYYNGTVRTFNNKAEMFPSNIIGNMFGFKSKPMFEVANEERQNIKVEF